jgi:hypothetical protein
VSARHQVKRLDRGFEEFAPRKSHPAEETGFLRSVRISWSAVSPAARPSVKSGPDVFADALVPGTPSFPERFVPTLAASASVHLTGLRLARRVVAFLQHPLEICRVLS